MRGEASCCAEYVESCAILVCGGVESVEIQRMEALQFLERVDESREPGRALRYREVAVKVDFVASFRYQIRLSQNCGGRG